MYALGVYLVAEAGWRKEIQIKLANVKDFVVWELRREKPVHKLEIRS